MNKDLIKKRKAVYGDNFECIAKAWKLESGAEVALMMAGMKKCRIDAIKKKLREFPSPDVYMELESSLQDSEDDRDNYLWIARNYKEYQKL